MGEIICATKSVLVGIQAVNIISYLWRGYTLYLDIGSASHKVLGFSATSDSVVVSNAPTPTVNPDWGIVIITDDDKDLDKLCVYGVKCSTTVAPDPLTSKL